MASTFSHHLITSKTFFLLLAIQAFVVSSETHFSRSLQLLQEAQKGDTFEGLNQVKKYFKAFGYYPNAINLTDEFDDLLESALKTFQKTYHLEATGKMDFSTIERMLTPRCGVTDNFENSNDHLDFDMIANYTFFEGMPKWRKRQLTYKLSSSAYVISDQQLRPLIRRALQRWADVSEFTFQEALPILFIPTDIMMGFHRGFHWDSYPFDGPGRVLAHAFAPQDGRLHFDADENWSTNFFYNMNQIDLESIAVHEMGHILGLGHSRDPNAVMYAYYRPGTIKRDLSQDDIAGIRALYG